jgi:hypothetical protein
VRQTLDAGFACANATQASRKWESIAHRGVERVSLAILFSAVVMLAGGCGGDSGTNSVPGGNQSTTAQQFTVDQTGGTIVYRSPVNDVTVTLTIPPGALNGSTVITIDHAQNFPAASGLVTGAVFDFGPNGLVFNFPANLSIAYGASIIGGLPESDLRIQKVNGSSWEPLLGSVDAANNIVSTTINGFSIFGLKTIAATGGTPPPGGGGTPPPSGGVGTDTWATIQADILQGRCVLCHNNSGFAPEGLSWEADQFDNVVTGGRASNQVPTLKEIEPGNADASYTVWKINGQGPAGQPIQGLRMPASGPPFLTQAEIDRITAWINAGAPGTGGGGTSPPPPPPLPPPPSGGGGTDPTAIIPTWFGVQANILQPFCTSCHGGPSPLAGLSWEVDQYDTIVTNGRLSTEIPTMREVQPGNPDTSYIVWKLRGQGPAGQAIVGLRMPASGPPFLDEATIDVIAQWIRAGAPLGVPSDATSGGSSGPPPPVVGSWMYVWTESLQICTLCHSRTPSSPRCVRELECPPKDVVLTADNYSGVVDDDEVRPFRLDNSKLWEMVTESDPEKRMPLGLPPLSQRQLDIIRNWINNGAPFCPAGEVCP